ncbi:low temperature requirement protein A [Micromonospora sp. WMMA1998]|uniref:low temperature requirement protein A n=1 Tax=Micromonospora sp. WMMA1998 TaxID=3015167 RepID=UPI00248CD501|nr:low temperature requirement protein A [Micromonospora sp. WMMA1998]WBC16128.1 low temperature requirement protein A [Micromonospora sp. WMMA1998]
MGPDGTRRRPGRPRPPRPAASERRVTPFEIFFDLVFVFALTRIMALVGPHPEPAGMAQGLLLLVLLWLAWSSYTWLGNHTRADVGVVRGGFLVAMAALFLAALVMPQAWTSGPGLDGPLLVALAYVLLRAVHLALFHWAAAGDPALRARIRFFALSSVAGWVPLLLGALLGGAAHAALWVLGFVVEVAGQRLSYARRGSWPLRSPTHFAERHGLVLIIALGESVAAAGVGAASAVTALPVLGAALVGFVITVALWWLYFHRTAPAAARALAVAPADRRDRIAADAYSQTHLLLVAGVIYLALGAEQVLAHVAGAEHGSRPNRSAAVALYGGAALYLAGRLLFRRLTGQAVGPARLVVTVATALLSPLGVVLPPAAALLVLAALLVTAVGLDRLGGAPAGRTA